MNLDIIIVLRMNKMSLLKKSSNTLRDKVSQFGTPLMASIAGLNLGLVYSDIVQGKYQSLVLNLVAGTLATAMAYRSSKVITLYEESPIEIKIKGEG